MLVTIMYDNWRTHVYIYLCVSLFTSVYLRIIRSWVTSTPLQAATSTLKNGKRIRSISYFTSSTHILYPYPILPVLLYLMYTNLTTTDQDTGKPKNPKSGTIPDTRTHTCIAICLWFPICIGFHICTYILLSIHTRTCIQSSECMYARVCMYAGMHECMSVWMYECMYVCIYECMHVYMYVYVNSYRHTYMHVCMYTCIQVHACVYVCVYSSACMRVCMRIFKCMRVCMYVYMHVHTCVYVCVYACAYVCVCTWQPVWQWWCNWTHCLAVRCSPPPRKPHSPNDTQPQTYTPHKHTYEEMTSAIHHVMMSAMWGDEINSTI